MTAESMRKRFEAWYAENAFDYAENPVGSRDCGLQWKAWQAATLAEQERAAKVCEELANLMESGAGEKEPGHRLRQAARNIRKGE